MNAFLKKFSSYSLFARVSIAIIVFSSVLFLAIFYLRYFPGVPLGWDAPYYIYKNQFLRAEGLEALISAISSVRVGYAITSAFITEFFHISARTVELVLPIVLQLIISLQISYLFYKIFRRLSVFITVYLLSLLSFSINDLVLRNNSDNLFALAVGLFSFLLLLSYIESQCRKHYYLIFVAITFFIVGITHLETFILFQLTYFFAGIFLFLQGFFGSFRNFFRISWGWIGTILLVDTVVGLVWAKYLPLIFSGYREIANTVGEGTGGYFAQFNLWDFISDRSYVGLYIYGPLILIAVTVFLFQLFRKRQQVHLIFLVAWILALAWLYIYFWFQGVPYNFMLRVAELTPLVSIALFGFWYTSYHFSKILKIIILMIFFVASIYNSVYAFTKIDHLFVPREVFHQLDSFQQHLESQQLNAERKLFVFVSSSKNEQSLGAFYGMWKNWIFASIPPQMINQTTVLFGEPENFFQCILYQETDREYESYANSFIKNNCLQEDAGYFFLLTGFYNPEVLRGLKNVQLKALSDGVMQIFPESSPLRGENNP